MTIPCEGHLQRISAASKNFSSGGSPEPNPRPGALLTSPLASLVKPWHNGSNSGAALAFSSNGTSNQARLTKMNTSEDENLDECGPGSRENITSFGDEPPVRG